MACWDSVIVIVGVICFIILIFSNYIYMWQFLMGFGAGVYVGTAYDCKPTIIFMKDCFKKLVPDEAIPKKKDEK